jgi:alanine racemase
MSPPFRSYALISREQIARNYRSVCQAVGPGVEVLGVVKADAYGHGAVEVSRVLVGEGARWLGVSSVDEGVALRSAGITARILVMAGFLPHEIQALLDYDLTPTAHAIEDIAELDRIAQRSGKMLRYHLKLDTGMGRLGTRAGSRELIDALHQARASQFEGLMTHFASAADYASPQTDEQVRCFGATRAILAAAGFNADYVHMSSTIAIAYGRREAWHNLVRAGHAIYGYVSPARGGAPKPILQVRPALTWRARILRVKDIPEGALIGYGGTFRAPRAMRVAVIGAGYADGMFHRLSNRGKVIAAGKLTPILGTVSMDLTTIDVSHAPWLAPGDEVTLLGSEGEATLDAQQVAKVAGTISYNILCSISARVRRVYV